MDPFQYERYSRHLVLPQVGLRGQERLLAARVVIVGMGGLGNPVAQYLAAAGLGSLTLIDHDRVSLSNLQRQVLFSSDDVGKLKVDIAAQRLRILNPDIKIQTISEPCRLGDVLAMVAQHEVIIDCTDNFAARYLLNQAAIELKVPLVHAAIHQFEAQFSVFNDRGSPCYRCLFPRPPKSEDAPNCAEAGVMGALAGMLGSMQALEAIKLVLGIGTSMAGRLLLIDTLNMAFRELKYEAASDCASCAGSAKGWEDLSLFEPQNCPAKEPEPISNLVLNHEEALRVLQDQPHIWIDIRTSEEVNFDPLGHGMTVPMDELLAHPEKYITAPLVILSCFSGARSLKAATLLQKQGWTQVKSYDGGLLAWRSKASIKAL